MKNSTLINILIFGSIFGWLFFLFTDIMLILLSILTASVFIIYITGCIVEFHREDAIKHKYNIIVQISRFYKWIDSKPKIIKTSKKNWRIPDNWDGEI